MSDYNPSLIEPKWQKYWQKHKTFQVDLAKAKNPYYNLMMFPYPSAEGLHVGNVYAFVGADIWGRFMKMQGFDVFEPIGLDGFGIHSENYALKVGKNPVDQAKISEKHFYDQLHQIGNQFSWDQHLETYDPQYYHWTQWIFVRLFKAGLAYRKKAAVNWCPSCKTVLADEQVIDELCERCSQKVEKKDLEQWFFKITDYADRLLNNLAEIDWTEKVKLAQKNWIGKSEGIEISYPVVGSKKKITCFTTRPDTNFGATFLVLAPEHQLVDQITSKENRKAVSSYIDQALRKTKNERMLEKTAKTGVFTGACVFHPLTKQKLPVWVSDFVLMDVASGAVVGVPGHDRRDFEFAQKFNLPIIRVVAGPGAMQGAIKKVSQVWEGEGKIINSSFLNDLESREAKEKIMDFLEKHGFGKRKTHYHLRDWLISRQRYWGPPIPMINCPKCGWQPVLESDLPVLLPQVKDWRPKGTGRGPLAQLKDWLKIKCPKCGGSAERETDVSDTFLDSSWYFLRYPSICKGPALTSANLTGGNVKARPLHAWDKDLTKKWLPVNMYIGGAEHSVLHLLYSRFITMFFHDQGFLDFEEPYTKFRAHGLIIKDGVKMSKSKGNIVNPDWYIAKFGADSLRCYLMFIGPLSQGGDFRDTGMAGMHRFLSRVYRLVEEKLKTHPPSASRWSGSRLKNRRKEEFWINKTIKRVTEDIKRLKYNTSLAAIMEYMNFLDRQLAVQKEVSNLALETLVLLIAPFAPHMAEELWQKLVKKGSVHNQPWPKYNPELIQEEEVEIVIQINGKLRDKIRVKSEKIRVKSEIIALALASVKIQQYFNGKKPEKTIFVPGRLVNFVV